MEEQKSTPTQAQLKPAPLMGEIHDDTTSPTDEEKVSATEKAPQDKNEEKVPESKHPLPSPASSHSPLPVPKRSPIKRFVLIALVTLLVAFAVALYFLVFAAKEDNDKEGKPAYTEQQVDNSQKDKNRKQPQLKPKTEESQAALPTNARDTTDLSTQPVVTISEVKNETISERGVIESNENRLKETGNKVFSEESEENTDTIVK